MASSLYRPMTLTCTAVEQTTASGANPKNEREMCVVMEIFVVRHTLSLKGESLPKAFDEDTR